MDSGGIETISAIIHSLEAGQLQVRSDALIGNQLTVVGGVSVGQGGIFSAGPVGIFSTTTNALSVTGNIANLTSTSTVKLLGSIAASNTPESVFVQGRYAYVNSNTDNTLQIFDIATSSPSFMGSVNTGVAPLGVHVAGKYAYLISNSANALEIYDISNPRAPLRTSVTALTGDPVTADARAVYVQGKYAYTVTDVGTLQIFDISNPYAPSLAGRATVGNVPYDVQVQGRYAYVVTTAGATIEKIDITDPTAPFVTGTAGVAAADDIFVSGKYAYVTGSAGLLIFDISTSSPSQVSVIGAGTTPDEVFVSGRYAYVVNSGTNDLMVFDVSNPASPTRVETVTTGTTPEGVFVSGRYAYIVHSGGTDALQVFDIGGIETTSAIIHSLEAGQLQVRSDALIGNQLTVVGGVSVGQGGIFSAGPLGVYSTTSKSSIMNSLAVGTSTPYATLSVWGSGTGLGKAFEVADNSSTTRVVILDNGSLGLGTTSPSGLLSIENTNATSTLYIDSSRSDRGGCIQLDGPASTTYRLYIDASGPSLKVEAGSCSGN